MTTPTGMSPSEPGAEVGRRQERGARRCAESGRTPSGGRPDQQAHDVRHDEPDEADQAADRDRRGGRQRRERRGGSAARALTSRPRWPAAASPSSNPSSDRPRAAISAGTRRG